jgi:hypothetical protein
VALRRLPAALMRGLSGARLGAARACGVRSGTERGVAPVTVTSWTCSRGSMRRLRHEDSQARWSSPCGAGARVTGWSRGHDVSKEAQHVMSVPRFVPELDREHWRNQGRDRSSTSTAASPLAEGEDVARPGLLLRGRGDGDGSRERRDSRALWCDR